jgi:hypothetical protein
MSSRIEMRHGYNIREKKYYLELIDVDTQDNMRVYLDAEDFRDFGQTIVDNVNAKELEKRND